jgi:hypothetical protein
MRANAVVLLGCLVGCGGSAASLDAIVRDAAGTTADSGAAGLDSSAGNGGSSNSGGSGGGSGDESDANGSEGGPSTSDASTDRGGLPPWCVRRCMPPANLACCTADDVRAPSCDGDGGYACPSNYALRSSAECFSTWRSKDGGACDLPAGMVCCTSTSDIVFTPTCTDAGPACPVGQNLLFPSQCGSAPPPPPPRDAAPCE